MFHPTTEKLRKIWNEDRIVNVEGVDFKMIGDYTTLNVGDTYVAGRNTEPKILTVARIDERRWIQPEESAYYYDWNECYKVALI